MGQPRRIRWAPKLPVAKIVQLYEADASRQADDTVVEDVGWRLYWRCHDVLLVSDSKLLCPSCGTTFEVPWVGQPDDNTSRCPECSFAITAAQYHASFEHQDLNGIGAREAFASYVRTFPRLKSSRDKMLAIDRLVHAVHTTGGVAARNLFEGRGRAVLAQLDALAGRP